MIVRAYRMEDLEALKAMHAQTVARAFRGCEQEYPMPDLSDPAFLVKLVAENGTGRPEMAAVVKLTSEVRFLMDGEAGIPETRWELLQKLQAEGERRAYLAGLDDVFCWIPPVIARAFGKRLTSLGWRRTDWPCFAKELRG